MSMHCSQETLSVIKDVIKKERFLNSAVLFLQISTKGQGGTKPWKN